MRIGVDGRCLNRVHLRGIARYAYSLMKAALERPELEFVVFGDRPATPLHVPDPVIRAERFDVMGDRFRTWEQIGWPWAASRHHCDLLHGVGMWCPYWQPMPTVVTIHDTLPWQGPHGLFLRHIAPASYRRARHIITVSAHSRDDIVARWPDLAGKTTVIHHGVDETYLAERFPPLPAALVGLGVTPPYLLYFGGNDPRKRLDWAIDTWTRVGDAHRVSLVACGVEHDARLRCSAGMTAVRRSQFVCLDFVPEADLPALYANAAAVLYPTLYEGFGFPALEAQAIGTPVLLSAVTSLTELTGPGAVVLPPDDLDAWVGACEDVLEGRVVRDAGRQWATRFTWRTALNRTIDVYRSAVSR